MCSKGSRPSICPGRVQGAQRAWPPPKMMEPVRKKASHQLPRKAHSSELCISTTYRSRQALAQTRSQAPKHANVQVRERCKHTVIRVLSKPPQCTTKKSPFI